MPTQHLFDANRRVNRLEHVFRATRPCRFPSDATGTQADPDLARRRRIPGIVFQRPHFSVGFAGKKILEQMRDLLRLHMAVGYMVNLNRGRERAAAETGHPLHGKPAVPVRVLALAQLQRFGERIEYRGGALDMARRAVAYPDRVFPHRPPPEPREERRDALEGRRRNVRDFTDPRKRRVGKVAEPVLQRVENRYHGLFAVTDLRHQAVNIGYAEFSLRHRLQCT